MLQHGNLFSLPLIAAMAGNVGVQSSAIVRFGKQYVERIFV
jgi:DNA-binding MurR/RpiR family transcriptional regulator